MNRKLIVWLDDNLNSARYRAELEPYRELLASRADLLAIDCIDAFAEALEQLAKEHRRVDALVLDLMLTVKQGRRRTFEKLGVGSTEIDAHNAGLQIVRILLMDAYRHPLGETPAAAFLEAHRGCRIALLSTCYATAEAEIFDRVRALDIREHITRIYEIQRNKSEAREKLSAFLDTI